MAKTSRIYDQLCWQVEKNARDAAAADRARARRIAFDEDAPDPRSAAIYRLVAHLDEAISDPGAKRVAFDLCREALRAGSPGADAEAEAEQTNMAAYATRSAATYGRPSDPEALGRNRSGDWPGGGGELSRAASRIPTGEGNTVDRRRQAADAGAGALDALFAEFPPAARPLG
jgi:hypothetical protein